MHTFYGPYRALEQKFITYLSERNPGPGRAVLVLCPSGRVADYLRGQLVRQNGLISNVFFQTFSQLTARLAQEAPGPRLPLLPGDDFQDYLLKNLLQQAPLNRYPISRGFVSALKSSLRDMADALADPEVLLEHLYTTTDPALEAEAEHIKWLIEIYRSYQEKMDRVPGFKSYQNYFQSALQQVEKSAWLKQFSEIIVYGFYELTGRQLELFQAVSRRYTTTVFWLYANQAAFAFGRKFFEANIMGSSTSLEELPVGSYPCAAGESLDKLFTAKTLEKTPAGLHFVSAPDPAGELFFVAKEMLRLHEQEGIAYADMAITARSLEPYKTLLPSILEQHAIGLEADFPFGLSAKPLGVFVLNLLSIVRGGFDREDICAVVSSVYFRQKNSWRYLIEESLAKRDYSQWTDLVRKDLPSYDPAFLNWLERTKHTLDFLEQAQDWPVLCERAQAFLEENLDIENLNVAENSLWQQVQETLQQLSRYTAARTCAQEREFLDEFIQALQHISLHQTYNAPVGATVADVSALRGLSFKVIFLLGMNEKSFPQIIREDPVLKDYYRHVLRDQLGFWINQKMERFEEERLLFCSIVDSVQEHLYLSSLRADQEGKPLVLSSYVTEMARTAQVDLLGNSVTRVPLYFYDRLQQTPLTYLTAKELSWKLATEGADAQTYVRAGLQTPLQETALEAARQLTRVGAPTPRDGFIQSGPIIFAQQNSQGLSPSALQDLAKCPMKYFLAKGVGLKEQEDILSREALAPNRRGTTYHEILKDYYQHLLDEGLSGQLFDSALQRRLDDAFAKHCSEQSYRQFGIYPVIWKLILQDMHDKLSDFVRQDAQQLGDYVPSIFETPFEKMYQPSAAVKLKLKGIIDRIDLDKKHNTFFIVDYKSSRHGGKDLAADMFKYVILQPFIYLLLAQQTPQTQGCQAAGAALLNINKGYARQELSADGFESVKEKAAQFFTLLYQLMYQGQFSIIPGEHCEFCPYGAICRKDSFRARIRARHAPLAAHLEEMRQ